MTGRPSTCATSAGPSARPGSCRTTRPNARPVERRRGRAPERQVALPDDQQRRVAHLEHGAGDRRVGDADVDDRERPVAERDRERGAGLGGRRRLEHARQAAARQQREPGHDLDAEPVERVGGRGGTGGEPVGDAGLGLGAEAEHRGLVAAEVDEPDRADATGGVDRAGGGGDGRTGATLG